MKKHLAYQMPIAKFQGNEFTGITPPSVFVSWHNYPKVEFAPMSGPAISGNSALLDNPEKWFGLSKETILEFRAALIRGTKKYDVGAASNPDYQLQEMQESVMAINPVDVNVKLKNAPSLGMSFSNFVAPLGPKAELEKFSLVDNPHIPKKVDYLVSDIHAKANDSLFELYNSDLPVHYLSNLLSAGLLGVKKDRTLTPTRWSITAVDSQLSENLIENEIKNFPELDEFQIFTSSYLDNHFHILLFPGKWCFENLECWLPGSRGSEENAKPEVLVDYEFYGGRKNYASNITGAYYAARLAAAEHLKKQKKQAGCIVIREIGKGYDIALGVWVIREAIRNAFTKKPLDFSGIDLALKYISSRLKVPINDYIKASKLLDRIRNQRKIVEYV